MYLQFYLSLIYLLLSILFSIIIFSVLSSFSFSVIYFFSILFTMYHILYSVWIPFLHILSPILCSTYFIFYLLLYFLLLSFLFYRLFHVLSYFLFNSLSYILLLFSNLLSFLFSNLLQIIFLFDNLSYSISDSTFDIYVICHFHFILFAFYSLSYILFYFPFSILSPILSLNLCSVFFSILFLFYWGAVVL